MKHFLLLLIAFLTSALPSFSQAFQWGQVQETTAPQIVSDGTNLIAASQLIGVVPLPNTNITQGHLLAKHDPNGKRLWAVNILSGTNLISVTTDNKKNVLICGRYFDSLYIGKLLFKTTDFRQKGKLYIAKFNPQGTLLWAKTSDTRTGTNASITTDMAGNIYFASAIGKLFTMSGQSVTSADNNEILMAKLDGNGNLLWLRNTGFLHQNVYYDPPRIIASTQNNVFAAFLSPIVNNNNQGITVVKFNLAGNVQWSKFVSQPLNGPLPYSYHQVSIALDSTEHLYLHSELKNATTARFDNFTLTQNGVQAERLYLAKLSSAGVWKWAKILPHNGPNAYSNLALEIRNELSFTCDYYDNQTRFEASYLGKVDTAGTIIFTQAINKRNYLPLTTYFFTNQVVTDTKGNLFLSAGVLGTIKLGPLTLTGRPLGPAVNTGHPQPAGVLAKMLNSSNKISGNLFIDSNGNNRKDVGERPFANGIVEIGVNQNYALSDSAGNYEAFVPVGTYQVSASGSSQHYTFTPVNPTVSFSQNGQSQVINFALSPIPKRKDAKISVTPLSQARTGQPVKYRLTYTNEGTLPLTDSLSFAFDPTYLTFDTTSQVPVVQGNNQFKWPYAPLLPNESRNIDLTFKVSTAAPRNSILNGLARIAPLQGDFDTSNNYDSLNHIIVGSYDPNDKQVNKATLTPAAVTKSELLDYVIRFQNTGNDTAFTVVVRDSISQRLDLSSFEMVSASHPFTHKFVGNNIIEWRFENILLPDSNRNEPASHAFIRYRIRPKTDLKPGNEITSRAAIYFDYNEPVYTNFAVTKIVEAKATLPDFYLYPNPTRNLVTIAADLTKQVSAKVTVVNMLGQKMQEVTLPANQQVHYKLPLNNLPKGVYIVQLETEAGMQTQRLVIQ